MKNLKRKGFSGIELTVVIVILTGLFNIFTIQVENTNEAFKSGVFANTVLKQESQEAIAFIQNSQIETGSFEVDTDYVSDLESEVEIETVSCDNNNVGHYVSIQQRDTEEIYSFNTCNLVKNQIKYEMTEA